MDEESDLLADAFSEAAQRLFWKGVPELTEIPWEEALLRQEHHGEEAEGCPKWPSLGSCSQSAERLELNFSAPVAPAPLWGQVLRDGPWTPPVQPATPGSWVWQNETRLHFWPDHPLAPATDFHIQGWNFRTEVLPVQISPPPEAWDPLRLESAGQEVRDEFRTDLSIQFSLRWNNPLDRDRFSPNWVQVSPELKDLHVFAYDERILIRGRGQPGCYEVDVCEKLQDTRGQFLGGTAFAKFEIERSPWFLFPAQPLQVLPRHHPPYFRCYSLGWSELLCRVMPVEPADWERYQSTRERPEGRIQAWQRRYWDFPIRPERLDRFETLALDLTAYMEGGSGHLLLEVTIPAAENSGKIPLGRKNFKSPGRDQSHTYGLIWLSYPELGLAAYADPGRTLLLSVLAQTGRQHGLQTISPAGPLRAELDSGQAFLPSMRTPAWDGTRLWAWLDRQKFRPGETVHAVGCWRRLERPDGTLQKVGPTTMSVAWWPCASHEKKRSQSPISESGHFSFELELPHDTPIGKHQLELEVPGGARAEILSFEVEEYPLPDFQVELSAQQRGPLWHFRAVARDRSGRPLESAQIQWKLVTQAVACRPPGWSEFHFGEELPQDRWSPVEANPPDDRQHKHQSRGLLSQQGEAEWQWLAQPYPEPPPPKRQPPPSRWGQGWRPRRAPQLEWRPALSGLRLSLEATVSSTLPSLPTAAEQIVKLKCLAQTADFCLGMRCQQRVYEPDQEPCVQVLVTDRLGNPVPGVRVELQVEGQKKIWEMTSRDRPQQLAFEAPPGLFVVRAWIRDAQGKVSLTRLHGYRLGTRPRPSKHSQLVCMLAQADYEVGDQAQLWIQAPASGTAVLRIGNGACCTEQIRHIDLGESCFGFPVIATMLPRATVRLELFGNERSGRPRCWVAEEQLRVVPPPALQVEIFQTRRDSQVDVFVTVTDPADGLPMEGASVSLLVVEEGLLEEGLCDWTDPMERFYPTKPTRMGSHNSWDHYRQATLQELLKEAQEAEFRGKCVTLAAPHPRVSRYSRWFAAPAHIAGCLTTSAEGVASTTFSLPNHPGPWRILAAAIYGIDRCGSSRQMLSLPSDWRLEVRWPAFARAGDELELELEVRNYGRESQVARIDLRGRGFHLHEPGGVELDLPPERSAELTFPLRAGRGPCLQFQILLKVAGQQQLLEHRLPSLPPQQGWRWLLCEELAQQILAAIEQDSRPPEFDLWCRLLRRRKRGRDFVTHWGDLESEAVRRLAEHALLRAEGQTAEPLELISSQGKAPAGLWLGRKLQARDDSEQVELLAADHWRLARGARVRLVLEIFSLEHLDRLYLQAPLPAALEPLVGSPSAYPWRSLWTRPLHPGHRPISSREDGWRCVEVSPGRIEACALGLPPGRSELLCECWATQSGRFWMPPALVEDQNDPSCRAYSQGCWVEVL